MLLLDSILFLLQGTVLYRELVDLEEEAGHVAPAILNVSLQAVDVVLVRIWYTGQFPDEILDLYLFVPFPCL